MIPLRTATWPNGMIGTSPGEAFTSIDPPLRLQFGAIDRRSPASYRFGRWGIASLAAMVAIAAPSVSVAVVAAAVALGVATSAVRAGRWRPFVDDDGWHLRGGAVPWREIARLQIDVRSQGDACLVLRDGSTRAIWAGVETAGPAGWFGAELALGRLAHQVAHHLGRPPVPIVGVDRRCRRQADGDPACTSCRDMLRRAG